MVDKKLAMKRTGLSLQTGSAGAHDHLVEFYDTDAFLVDTVCELLLPALGNGDTVIVTATAAHEHKFAAALGNAGIDVAAAVGEGRYVVFDAEDLPSHLMVDGSLEATRFCETLGAVMDRASQGGRQIRVYSEMAALLWAGGDETSALAIGDLWNELAETRSFMLLSAYPMREFDDEASAPAFKRICEQHTTVIPSEGYSLLADPAERSRAVAQLQQQAAARHLDVRRPGAQRDQAGDQRDQAGDQRDQAGDERDQAADQRDQAADQRDQAAERSEASENAGTAGASPDPHNRSALARQEAASDRKRASQDRRAGASERIEAELDRNTALADRGTSAREREHASRDDLTDVYLRGAGFVELERDIARARRTGQPLIVAFIDVDHLKRINDSHGHAAGDRMLLEVAHTLAAELRSYDLIIRYGGDEFVCAISGLNMADAARRMAFVNLALAAAPEHGSVTVGLAELRPYDSPQDLVARADTALYRERQLQRSARA